MAAPLTLPLDVRLMDGVANALFVLLAVLALGSVGWWAARHPAWSLAGITVQGDVTHQNAVTFRAHLASRLHGSFLTLDLQEVQRLFEGVPWVRQAVVQREFPNRLTVTLQEHQAVAWWGETGGGRLLNTQGEVFEANPDDPQADQWSELLGPDGQSAQVYALYQALRPLFARMDQDVTRLELSSRGNWRVTLERGARIDLGRGEPAELLQRTQDFVATVVGLNQRYGGRDIESADLRYPNGYALRLRGVTTLTEPAPGTPKKP
ncbi:cell division protein FtsQ/DivIB [Aquabacterium sp. A08]|uniref:cell division protein FtsQ/DivIB n=1 Tax=Aquabacterium sp. A08 TaxID=2718532 RepID=UPI0014200AF4|nr:cell division protein FtsQ/DivIB [Aquabacterium sp. A08]NIC40561.1 FtsQ-type POTRA domain-containing protein [Aquabacterium sp. A08]